MGGNLMQYTYRFVLFGFFLGYYNRKGEVYVRNR